MSVPDQLLLSNLLKHRVRCNLGIDHGPGSMPWMHPPAHRLLGWVSKPSSLRMNREVWKLNQLRGIGNQQLYVKGIPSITDQLTLDRLPTLIDSDLLNNSGDRLGSVVDMLFQPKTGKILHYLISRTDKRIPGTSRWRLEIRHIVDQQPGMVSTNLISLDDLPLSRSSIRQDFLRKSRDWRDQINEISNKATDRLEGWLEDPPWDDPADRFSSDEPLGQKDSPENWFDETDDQIEKEFLDSPLDTRYSSKRPIRSEGDSDPWV